MGIIVSSWMWAVVEGLEGKGFRKEERKGGGKKKVVVFFIFS